MGKILQVFLFLGVLGISCVRADLLTGVQGPDREKRRSPTGNDGFYDCAPGLGQLPAPNPVNDCLPGMRPRYSPAQLSHGLPGSDPSSPCPRMDRFGRCYVGNRRYNRRLCSEFLLSRKRRRSPPGNVPSDCVPI